MMNQRWKQSLGILLALFVLFGSWWLGSWFVQKPLLPTPGTVLLKLPELFTGVMAKHLQTSFIRIGWGLAWSVLGGYLLGLLMGSFPKWHYFFDPLIYFTYPIPKMALLPIVMLLGGLGDKSKIIMIVLIVLPQVVISVRDAVRVIPQNYYHVYRCLAASRWTQFRAITFPATIPATISALRVSLGTAISILFFTENYGTEYGMGYYIMDSWTRMDYPAMYAGILMLSGCGFVLFLILDQISNRVNHWQKS